MRRPLLTAAVVLAVPLSAGSQAFDFEATAPGSYLSLTVTNGGQTLTATAPGAFVLIDGTAIASGMGLRGAIGTASGTINGPFRRLQFSFLQPVSSITFLFGDFGGEDDTPARIQAFDPGNSSLGIFDYPYVAGQTAAGSASLTFGGAGASSFLLSSPSGNPNSIFWEVSASTIATSAVPEPTTTALVAGGLLALVGAARRRRAHA